MKPDDLLQSRMLDAHKRADLPALPALYLEAARIREQCGDVDAACYFFTHAYVYALDAGDENAARLALGKLQVFGRES
jgi:hypothetical protein